MQFVKHHRSALISAFVLLILASLLTFNHQAVAAQLNDWKLLPQPERLTELYFDQHAKLPTTYLPGTAQAFSFSVHNLEYRPTTYSYSVSQFAIDGTQPSQVAAGNFSLGQDQFKSLAVDFMPAYVGDRSRIVVSLTNRLTRQSQTIDYYVTSLVSASQYQAEQQAAQDNAAPEATL